MSQNLWHFPRTVLAQQIIGMFDSGLSNALTFFAPRRMGKTEFLLKDIKPYAEKQHWQTFYFSFLEPVLKRVFFLLCIQTDADFWDVQCHNTYLSRDMQHTSHGKGITE